MFFLCMSIAAKSQYLNMKTFVVNENLRKELLLINHYVEELRQKKIISEKNLFIRFEAGENSFGEILNLRFLGNYYRNLSNGEELYFKVSDNLYYIFDASSTSYLQSSMNFLNIKSDINLKDYGEPKLEHGFIVEMGEMSFDIICGNVYLNLVTSMPNIELYYAIKFSVDRGAIFYENGE